MGNQKGQALLESLVLVPFFKVALIALIGGLYAFMSYYYIDFQSQQAALCLEKEEPESFCKSEFEKNVNLVPFIEIHWSHVYRNDFTLHFESNLSTLTMKNKLFSYQWSRPLKSNDFGDY